jgi:hypothetical protein
VKGFINAAGADQLNEPQEEEVKKKRWVGVKDLIKSVTVANKAKKIKIKKQGGPSYQVCESGISAWPCAKPAESGA